MNDDQTLLIDAAALAAQWHHYTVIDCRFEWGHIPGALNVPWRDEKHQLVR